MWPREGERLDTPALRYVYVIIFLFVFFCVELYVVVNKIIIKINRERKRERRRTGTGISSSHNYFSQGKIYRGLRSGGARAHKDPPRNIFCLQSSYPYHPSS